MIDRSFKIKSDLVNIYGTINNLTLDKFDYDPKKTTVDLIESNNTFMIAIHNSSLRLSTQYTMITDPPMLQDEGNVSKNNLINLI